MTSPLAYSVSAACRVGGVGRTKLYQAIGRGELRAVKSGRRTLILSEDLRAWLQALPPIEPARPQVGLTPKSGQPGWHESPFVSEPEPKQVLPARGGSLKILT